MEKKITKEVAFFNLLKSLIPTNMKYSHCNISYKDLEEKMELDKLIIRNSIQNLESDSFIEILNETEDSININFQRTYDNLIEVFTVEDIDHLIIDMQDFIQRRPEYFRVFEENSWIDRYALEAKELFDLHGHDANINHIIKQGITDFFSQDANILKIKKSIFDICELADNEDLKALEAVLFCQFNFPVEENPFYVTLFLSKLFLKMSTIQIH